jgi:DNA-binding NarL/FixJ family response regulator
MRILLADDHPLFREGVRHVLAQLDSHVEIIDAHDYPSLFSVAKHHADLDLALVDLNMPGMDAHEAVIRFRSEFPGVPLVILSATETRADIQRTLKAGALGYIQKSSPSRVILDALHQVLAGDIYVPPALERAFSASAASPSPVPPHLTSRQLEVLKLLIQGKTNKTIGQRLGLSEGTVKIHMAAIFRALNVRNRTEATVAARNLGLVGDDPHSPF